jgi:hypothetical protein
MIENDELEGRTLNVGRLVKVIVVGGFILACCVMGLYQLFYTIWTGKNPWYDSPSSRAPSPVWTSRAMSVYSFDVAVGYPFVHVMGSAEAKRDCSYAQISFAILNSRGHVVGSALDNVNGLRKGEVWKFDATGTVNETGWDFKARVDRVVCW